MSAFTRPSGILAVILAVLALAVGLGACGKKGRLEAPEGEESAYTYPHFYPARSSVVPSGRPGAEEEEEEELEDTLVPEPTLSRFPTSPSRTTTKTYGSSPP